MSFKVGDRVRVVGPSAGGGTDQIGDEITLDKVDNVFGFWHSGPRVYASSSLEATAKSEPEPLAIALAALRAAAEMAVTPAQHIEVVKAAIQLSSIPR